MRFRFAFAFLLLPLGGCVVPAPAPYGYAGGGGQELSYPGYAYNDGSPTLVVEGATWPLVYYGGGWGYWDGYHHWHGAPGQVGHWLDGRHPGGYGYHPYGGGAYGHPVGLHAGPYGAGVNGAHVNGAPANGAHGTAVRSGQGGATRASTSHPAPARHRENEHH